MREWIPLFVIGAYVLMGLAFGIPMAVVADDPGGGVVLGVFGPFMVAGLLLILWMIIFFIADCLA